MGRQMLGTGLCAVVLAGTTGVSVPPMAANDVGLLGMWTFDEAEGDAVRDSGPEGLSGQITFPEHVRRVEGRSGRALMFTGEGERGTYSSVVIEGIGQHDLTSAFTVEAWVKLADDWGPRDTCYIATDGPFKGPGWRFLISWNSLALQSGDGDAMWGVVSSRISHGFRTGRWYHVAGTYDGSVYRIYVDGIEWAVSEPDASLPLTKGSDRLVLGSYRGVSAPLKGILDEVRIYRRARSPLEILKDARVK